MAGSDDQFASQRAFVCEARPEPLDISAIVVCRNEADKLADCLRSLRWCDQIIVLDLESTDASRTIAEQWADRVESRPFSPIVEPLRVEGSLIAKHDWCLFVDPDEQFPACMAERIRAVLAGCPDAASVRLPWQFYFKGRRLDGTVWGGRRRFKQFLVHRKRSRIVPLSLVSSEPLPGHPEIYMLPREENYVRHDWIDSYFQLFEKHLRYARKEGESRYERGVRFRWRQLILSPLRAARTSLVTFDGWRIGWRGVALSLFFGLFELAGQMSLGGYQWRQRHRGDDLVPCAVSPEADEQPERRKAA